MDNQNQRPGALLRPNQGGLPRTNGLPGRYSPIHEMQEQVRRMDALFNRAFGFEPLQPLPQSYRDEMQQAEPDTDIYESNTEYILHAALPGVEPHDIHLEATEDSIMLAGHRRSPFSSGAASGSQNDMSGQPGVQDGTQPGVQAGGQTGASTAEGTVSPPPASQPHTQHRQSRYSNESRFRMMYMLPTPIDPNGVRANLRNGVLELHLPKQQPVSARPITISVQSDAATGPSGANPIGQDGSVGTSGTQEGKPANKMGSAHMPGAGEDHAAQAQSIGANGEHKAGRAQGASGQTNPIASGQTNPMATSSPSTSTSKPKRS